MGKYFNAVHFLMCTSLLAQCKPPTNTEVVNKLDHSTKLKSLLRELVELADTDLRDLLLQLRAVRKLRLSSSPRDVAEIPVSQLTEEEVQLISSSVSKGERKKSHYIPLDIPHDSIRTTIPKTLVVFGSLRPGGIGKALDVDAEGGSDEEKRQEVTNSSVDNRSSVTDSNEDGSFYETT